MQAETDNDPTGRFTGLADAYARGRPTYPPDAIRHIVTQCGLGPGSVVVDVGCGTGISSRLFAAHGLQVTGVEPNEDMLRQARQTPPPPDAPAPAYARGTAEGTGLPDGSADLVLAAQSFHWFDPGPALTEFARVLRARGWVALVWNERDEMDPFTAAYGDLFRRLAPETRGTESRRQAAGDLLAGSELFTGVCKSVFYHRQSLDEPGLLDRAGSTSYAPRGAAEAANFAAELRQLFARHQAGGRVELRYQTSVYLGRRSW